MQRQALRLESAWYVLETLKGLMWLGPSGLGQGGPYPHLPPHLGSSTGLQTASRAARPAVGTGPGVDTGPCLLVGSIRASSLPQPRGT